MCTGDSCRVDEWSVSVHSHLVVCDGWNVCVRDYPVNNPNSNIYALSLEAFKGIRFIRPLNRPITLLT